MNKSRIISITILVLFHLMLIVAFLTHWGESVTYALLAFYIFLFGFWVIEYRKSRKIKALLYGIPAEHRLYGRNMMILQTGYIRMRIERLAAGTFSFKSHLNLSVNIPAGKEDDCMNDTFDAISKIIEQLQSEDLLVSYRMRIDSLEDTDDDEDSNPQRAFPLSMLIKVDITPERIGMLYNSLLEAITANGSNDFEQFTITGTESGTIYKHYRGNLCVGMIECEYDNRNLFNSSIDRSLYFGNEEKEYTERQYKELRDSIVNRELNLTLGEAAKYIKQILKKMGKGIQVSLFVEEEKLSVSVSNRKSSENIHLTKQDGLWWIYGYGTMMYIPILSTESKTEAIRMMLRLVMNVRDRLQNQ